jgi:hypothetical protein
VPYHRFPIVSFLCLLLLLSGCFSSERDNLQDPANTPILQLGDVIFDNATGKVVVSWSYIGQGAISRFNIERRIAGAFEQVGTLPGVPGGRLERQSLVFRDENVPAGERMFYRIAVPVDGGVGVLTKARGVTAPGARLVSITPNSEDGNIRISWRTSDDVDGVEVYRTTGNEDVLVFQTDDARERTFVDEGLQGAVDYHYYVKTRLPGYTLNSISASGSFFGSGSLTQVGLPSNAQQQSFIVVPRLSTSSSLNVYHHGADATIEHRYTVTSSRGGVSRGGLSTSRNGPVAREDRELAPSTLSVDTPGRELRVPFTSEFGSFTLTIELFISGISSQTGDVVLNAHSFGSTPDLSHRWSNEAGVTRTCLSTDPISGSIYLVSGRTLRILDSEFVPSAEFEVPYEPAGIEVGRTALWMAVPSPGRLLRGERTLSMNIPTEIVWSEVNLPAGSDPVALSSNQAGQVFVLDSALRRVHVLSPEGEPLFYWDLPDRQFDRGDIGVIARGEAFVLDNAGTIHSYLP